MFFFSNLAKLSRDEAPDRFSNNPRLADDQILRLRTHDGAIADRRRLTPAQCHSLTTRIQAVLEL
jgi:hypothetical protein